MSNFVNKRIGPYVFIKHLPRSMFRWQWKLFYRRVRIATRECEKAASDMLIYGIGTVEITDDGDVKHVPIQEVRFTP